MKLVVEKRKKDLAFTEYIHLLTNLIHVQIPSKLRSMSLKQHQTLKRKYPLLMINITFDKYPTID